MEVEKRRSKGGFLRFFDWNSKSRKKLFSNSPDIPGPDGVKHETDDAEILAKSRFQMNVIGENGVSSSKSGSSKWNCAASETSNEGSENRAPGVVVARLMGLDSLPKSNGPESSTLCFESHQVEASSYGDGTRDLRSRCDPIDYLSNSRRLGRFSSPCRSEALEGAKPNDRDFRSECFLQNQLNLFPLPIIGCYLQLKVPHSFRLRMLPMLWRQPQRLLKLVPGAIKGKASSTISASVPLRIQDQKKKFESSYEASR